MITIRLIDKTADPDLCAALPTMASLVQTQVNAEFRAAWGCDEVSVGVGNVAQDGEWPCFFVPKLDDPEALAYHDEEANGYPALYVGRDIILANGGTLLRGSTSILAALSHEVLEAIIDPWCIWYSQWTDARMVGLEVSDPCQDGCYDISDGKVIGSVSNFVLPEWFRQGPSRSGRYDRLGVLSAPLTLSSGGYVAFSDGTQIFGKEMPDWKVALKAKFPRRDRKNPRESNISEEIVTKIRAMKGQ
jgi:hypothetical protein